MMAYQSRGRFTPVAHGVAGPVDLRFRPGSVLGFLLACVTVLVAAGSVVFVARVGFGYSHLYGLGPLFDLDGEATVPAFFSAVMLLSAATLLGLIAMARGAGRPGTAAHWTLLAAGFLLLAFDEATSIHERFNRPIRELLDTPGFSSAWLVPAAVVLAALAVFYLPFLRALPRRSAAMFVGCGAIYLSGAVGLEGLNDVVAGGEAARGSVVHSAFVVLEEACEMIGIACFVYALLDYMACAGPEVRCRAEHAARAPARGYARSAAATVPR